MTITIHPWSDGLYVVTRNGRAISEPMPKLAAAALAVEMRRAR